MISNLKCLQGDSNVSRVVPMTVDQLILSDASVRLFQGVQFLL